MVISVSQWCCVNLCSLPAEGWRLLGIGVYIFNPCLCGFPTDTLLPVRHVHEGAFTLIVFLPRSAARYWEGGRRALWRYLGLSNRKQASSERKKKCPAAEQGATCQCAGGDEQQQQRGRCGSTHSLGEYRLIRELNFHTDCLQLYSRQFDCLLSRVGPPFRQPISPTDPYCLVFFRTGCSLVGRAKMSSRCAKHAAVACTFSVKGPLGKLTTW